jgi:hypothetical protein
MTDPVRAYIEQLMRDKATCPRCQIEWPIHDPWCAICGDAYPWPKQDDPLNFTEPRGLS